MLRRFSRPTSNSAVTRRLLVLGIFLVGSWVVAWLAAEMLVVQRSLLHADAIAVLAGSGTYNERAQLAARRYHEGAASLILLTNDQLMSGWSPERDRNPAFVERSIDVLSAGGVPHDRIKVIPENVENTYDEVSRLRTFAQEHNLQSIIIICSPYQSRRVLWTTNRVFRGSNVQIGIESPNPGLQSPHPAVWMAFKLGWKLVPGEYLKMAYYRWHYR